MKFDIFYGNNYEVYAEPHFCREWEDKGGCYGTNPEHGFTWEEVCQECIDHYEMMVTIWKERKEKTYEDYVGSS